MRFPQQDQDKTFEFIVSERLSEESSRRDSLQLLETGSFYTQQQTDLMSFKSLPAINPSSRNRLPESKSSEYWELGRLGPDMSDPERLEQVSLLPKFLIVI